MFRPCNRVIVRLFNRDHQIDYIIGVFFIVSVEQPDDGPIAGPKHVVVIYYIV